MKKVLATIAMLAIPGVAMAVGLIGDCYDCHTMHNSESGQTVALVGGPGGTAPSAAPQANLLKYDCMACHANDPTGGTKVWSLPGGSAVPQVAHGDITGDLAGGNFSYGFVGNGTSDKVHNVSELFTGQYETYTPAFGNPPGMVEDGGAHNDIFTTGTNPYDKFSCAGNRGCHGTRNQEIGNGTGNAPRVGMAAISGAHHVNADGQKGDTGYQAPLAHDGAEVAAGYRMIPGLFGYGNEVDRWENKDATSHNEYYGDAVSDFGGSGCATCHNFGTALTSNLKVPNNSMSGFCSTCHGNFHSSGKGTDYDQTMAPAGRIDNGVSGAFLRHPSDYVIPNSGEYAGYTAYNITAPVARPALAAAASSTVAPGTDLVMCLSCHAAHGTANDYILRFDYSTMTAGFYADKTATDAAGGCLACHTAKGIQQ